jgi:hypothetical protein
MKTQLNETGNFRTILFYYGDCDEKGHFFGSLQPVVLIGSFGFFEPF